MYVKRSTEARLRNHYCRGKAISIIYWSVCVCVCVNVDAWTLACAPARVALLIKRATHRHIVICGLSGSIIFFDIF
jgi:hypothetical protein